MSQQGYWTSAGAQIAVNIDMRARIRTSIQNGIRLLVSAMLCLHPTTSFALEVEINKSIDARTFDGSEMSFNGWLDRGTVVEIPDQYVKRSNGKVNFELTLNNWLRRGGKLSERQSKRLQRKENGAGKYNFYLGGKMQGYFFPVKVKGKNSDKDIYIDLEYLSRKKDALRVREKTPVFTAKEPEEKKLAKKEAKLKAPAKEKTKPETQQAVRQPDYAEAPPTQPEDQTEAANTAICEDCKKSPVQNLLDDLPKSLGRVEVKTAENVQRVKDDQKGIRSRFEKSCGISYDVFQKELHRELRGNTEDIKLWNKLMAQESSGDCEKSRHEDDGTESVGLFQVNFNESTRKKNKYNKCTVPQLIDMKTASLQELRTDYQCLENPLVNLKESIRIFEDKKRYLRDDGFDFSKINDKDRLRMLFSAYNGGQKWVGKAKEDLLAFNTKHGTKLDYNNWEDLRIFYLRRALTGDEQMKHFGNIITRRKLKHAISNLAYAEAMVPRETVSE